MPALPAVPESTGKGRNLLVICALLFVLLLGWATLSGYGQPWDEQDEMDILRMNLWEYANALGQDTSAFADWAAARQSDPSASLLDAPVPISQSKERDHGESAFYPLAGVMMSENLSPSALSTLWHGYTWFLFWLGGVALYFVCRHAKLSVGVSLSAVAMLVLTPRFFAEGHYNSKDIVLMSLVLITLWQSLRLGEKPGLTAALLFGLSGAIATNTKIIGLFIFGLCFLFVAARLVAEKRTKAFPLCLAALVAYAGFYALLTPALWGQPLEFFKYVLQNAAGFTRWKGYVLFRGTVFDTSTTASLPWYYLPYTIFVTTPLWIWLFFGAGQGFALLHMLSRKVRTMPGRAIPDHEVSDTERPDRAPGGATLLLCTLLWVFPLGFAVLSRAVVYNGWRHFYFLYGPMLVLAAYGLTWLWEHVRNIRWQRYATLAALILCAAQAAASLALNHPYQYAYYNSLIPMQSLNAYMERDYWNVSIQSALEALRQSEAYRSLDAPVLISGVDLWAENGVRQALAFSEDANLELAALAEETAQFLLVNHTYQHYSGWMPSQSMAPIVQVEAYGRPLITIYQSGAGSPAKEFP